MKLIFMILLFSLTVSAQEINLEKFLDKAQAATVQYRETFKNLVAEEMRTFEYFRNDGTLDDSRKIKSIFVVYQSTRDKNIWEYRNVIEFNGKNVAREDDDIVKFFNKLAKASSGDEEFERLRKEANRFDGRMHAYGLTLGQGKVLQPFYREFFEFKIIGKEKIEGRDVVIVEYKQTKLTLRIKVNETKEERQREPSGISFDAFMSSKFQPTNPLMQGKLWLDAETAQIWRDEYSVSIHPAILSKRTTSSTFLDEYRSSSFGILLPKKLSIEINRFSGSNAKNISITKAAKMSFEYSKFSKADSEVKETKTGN